MAVRFRGVVFHTAFSSLETRSTSLSYVNSDMSRRELLAILSNFSAFSGPTIALVTDTRLVKFSKIGTKCTCGRALSRYAFKYGELTLNTTLPVSNLHLLPHALTLPSMSRMPRALIQSTSLWICWSLSLPSIANPLCRYSTQPPQPCTAFVILISSQGCDLACFTAETRGMSAHLGQCAMLLRTEAENEAGIAPVVDPRQ
mmetsp:Transcript_30831/g.62632  ORF Transcript_30831/g.62632 Transcript_30831/m.62632 type:complete len:201 (+) Transcript_30831:28-630(+)